MESENPFLSPIKKHPSDFINFWEAVSKKDAGVWMRCLEKKMERRKDGEEWAWVEK